LEGPVFILGEYKGLGTLHYLRIMHSNVHIFGMMKM